MRRAANSSPHDGSKKKIRAADFLVVQFHDCWHFKCRRLSRSRHRKHYFPRHYRCCGFWFSCLCGGVEKRCAFFQWPVQQQQRRETFRQKVTVWIERHFFRCPLFFLIPLCGHAAPILMVCMTSDKKEPQLRFGSCGPHECRQLTSAARSLSVSLHPQSHISTRRMRQPCTVCTRRRTM
jgi:hypothetical protein